MIPENPTLTKADLGKWPKVALAACVVGVIVCLLAFMNEKTLYELQLSYLVAFIFWSSLALGSLALLMIQYLSGGGWGLVLRRVLEAGSRMVYWIPILWLPIGAAAILHTDLYEWTHQDNIATDHILQQKEIYLNVPFWITRSVIYFVIWITLAFLLNHWSRMQDKTGDQRYLIRMRMLSGPGMVLYALTVTFAAVDYMMSLEPHWFSTMYGALLGVGQLLAALCFSAAVVTLLARFRPVSEFVRTWHLHDWGKLIFGFILLWAYLNFSQFLIIWSGNLLEEIPWYLHRLKGGWQWVGGGLIAFHFIFPFLFLLSRKTKKKPILLVSIAFFIIFMRFVDLYFAIIPSASWVHGAHDHYFEGWRWWPFLFTIAAMSAVGGFWLWRFLGGLTSRPLLPINDPYLEEAVDPHGGGH